MRRRTRGLDSQLLLLLNVKDQLIPFILRLLLFFFFYLGGFIGTSHLHVLFIPGISSESQSLLSLIVSVKCREVMKK